MINQLESQYWSIGRCELKAKQYRILLQRISDGATTDDISDWKVCGG